MIDVQERKSAGWREFFSSSRLTVYLLIALGLAVFAGTLIPQKGVTLSPEVLAEKMAAPLWRALNALGFFDVFRSIWFLTLVALLVLNLVFCTIAFLQRTHRQLAQTGRILDAQTAARLPLVKTRSLQGAPASVAAILAGRFRQVGRVEQTEKAGVVYLFAQNSPLWRYGNVIIHLSILFILAGVLLRVFFGLEGELLLPEGGEQNIFLTNTGHTYRLPFEVRCDRFEVEFYPGGRQPKEYRSELSLRRDGREWLRQSVEVNQPLKAGAFRFFQANYGQQDFPVLRISFRGRERDLPVIFGRVQSIPETEDGLVVEEGREIDGHLEILVRVATTGEPVAAWLAEGGAAQTFGAYQLGFSSHREGMYTGLMVTADPGVSLVWFGMAVFFLGLLWSLLGSHRRVWAKLDAERWTLAGSASKKREQLEKWFAQVIAEVERKQP